MFRNVSLFGLLVLSPMADAQVLRINEVMASNDATITDDQGTDADWIELFNAGDAGIDLAGHWVSDDPYEPQKHQLPAVPGGLWIPAGGHLVLWASGNAQQGPAHLPFSLSASGETVLIAAPDGQTLDAVSFDEQLTDVSYGRSTDGGTEWLFFAQPTPGATNNGSAGAIGFLGPVEFSTSSGFHGAPFTLSLTAEDDDVQILWSSDGSAPDPYLLEDHVYPMKNQYQQLPAHPQTLIRSDTMRCQVYQGPFTVSAPPRRSTDLTRRAVSFDHAYSPPYMPSQATTKAAVIRARAFKPGYLPGPVSTHIYFFTPSGINPYRMPIVSLTMDREHLIGYTEGIHVAGEDFDTWRSENPTEDAWRFSGANWHRDTEYPVGVQMLDSGATTSDYSVNAGFRMHGSSSRHYPRKSMRLYFRDTYGPGEVGRPVFKDGGEGSKRLIIHSSGNDEPSTNLRDMTLQSMVRHMRFTTQRATPAALFVNGEFWGINAIRDRYDRHFLQERFGLEAGSIDLVEKAGIVEEGDAEHYNATMELLASLDMNDPQAVQAVRARIDTDDLIDHCSANIFIGNTDWPHNNIRMYRKRLAQWDPLALPQLDGRWRTLMYDTDFGFGLFSGALADHDMMAWALHPTGNGNGAASTLVFRRMMENPELRTAFILRHADMLNTAFRASTTIATIDSVRSLIEPNMQEHFLRWRNRPGSQAAWLLRLQTMYTFAEQRPAHARAEVMARFGLAAQHALTLDVSDPLHGYVHLNTIDILPSTRGVDHDPYPWTGTYFEGVPVKLTAVPLPGYAFSHWEGGLSGTEAVVSVHLVSALTAVAVFVPGAVCPEQVLHHWHFNDLPDGPLTEVMPDGPSIGGGRIRYVGDGAGYMDRTNTSDGTELNAQEGIAGGRAIRMRNPSDTRSMVIDMPSTGHRDMKMSFATTRTSNGAQWQQAFYTVDPAHAQWFPLSLPMPVSEEYEVRQLDLTGLTATYDAPHLALRIVFSGSHASGASGNDRFDNLIVRGHPMERHEATFCAEGSYAFNGEVYTEAGSYVMQVDTAMDCGNWTVLDLSSVTIPDDVLAMEGGLTALAEDAQYQWLDCSEDMAPIIGAVQRHFTPSSNGSFAVRITAGGCEVVSDCHAVTHVGVEELSSDGWKVYPNPTYGTVTVLSPTLLQGRVYRVIDLQGAVRLQGAWGPSVQEIDLSMLAPGLYELRPDSRSTVSLRLVVL